MTRRTLLALPLAALAHADDFGYEAFAQRLADAIRAREVAEELRDLLEQLRAARNPAEQELAYNALDALIFGI